MNTTNLIEKFTAENRSLSVSQLRKKDIEKMAGVKLIFSLTKLKELFEKEQKKQSSIVNNRDQKFGIENLSVLEKVSKKYSDIAEEILPHPEKPDLKEKKLIDGKIYRLFNQNYYREYSKREFWYVDASCITGLDDSGFWAKRVPATCTTVEEALLWLEPKEVQKSENKYRQGDLYLIQKKREGKYTGLYGRHQVVQKLGFTIVKHPEHKTLIIKGLNLKPIQQRRIAGSVTD